MSTVDVQKQRTHYPSQYRGSIVHDHAHYTNEGFGSLARNMIYPIIHIALSCHLQPYISNTSYDYNTSRPNYKTHLHSIAHFLSLPEYPYSETSVLPPCGADDGTKTTDDNDDDGDDYTIIKIEINTWNDTNIGSCCGDAMMIAKELSNYLHITCSGIDNNRNHNNIVASHRHWFDIRLVGAIRGMDPTPIVYQWLQNISKTWIATGMIDSEPKRTKLIENTNDNYYNNRNHSTEDGRQDQTSVVTDDVAATTITTEHDDASIANGILQLRIVAHVRVPEDFTCQHWKDDNHIDKLYAVLDTILQTTELQMIPVTIEIYTEEQFDRTNELELMHRYQNRAHVQEVQVHRGTTESLLKDIQCIVQRADVFIPSSSYLSAFCGYLFPVPGIMVVSHPSRWQYFTSHQQLMLGHDVDDDDDDVNHSSHQSRIIDMTQLSSSSLKDNQIWYTFISTIQARGKISANK